MNSYWVVIPALNEQKYISSVLAKVKKYTANIVVVDDGSHDKTSVLATKYTQHVLKHRINLGKGAALKTGCEYVFKVLGGDAVVFIDSDDQHDPAELPHFFQGLDEGSQVIFGIRSLNTAMPLFRRSMNLLASLLIQLLFGAYIPDIPSGYKALTKKAYRQIQWKAQDYAVEMEIAAKVAKNKLSYTIIPIKTIYHDLQRGMTFLDILKMTTQIISWRIFP